MSEPAITFGIRPAGQAFSVVCAGFKITGFPSHGQASEWVLEYILRMLGQHQRQNLTEKWLGGKQGLTE